MAVTQYKLWKWGDRVGSGAMGSHHVAAAGIAKPATDSNPYALANEYICGALARALRLPIPPGFFVEREGDPHYVSLNFNLAGEDLPPADAAQAVRNHAELAWGITLFDVWVVNDDRHNQNLAYDKDCDQVQIFDHSHAFMRGKKGRDHLGEHEEGLGIGDKENGRNKHCLSNEIQTLDGFWRWSDRIRQVPEFYIREAVEASVGVGLPEEQVDFCADFLVRRQSRIEELVRENRDRFPKLESELLEADDQEEDDEKADDQQEDENG